MRDARSQVGIARLQDAVCDADWRSALRQADLGEHQIDEATNSEEALQNLRGGPLSP